jgi:hypothetical protein
VFPEGFPDALLLILADSHLPLASQIWLD